MDGNDEYNPSADFARSIDECYRAIRERVLAGGPGWGGWPADVRVHAGGQARQRPDSFSPLAAQDCPAPIPTPLHRCARTKCDAMNHELWQRWYREADEADARTTAVDLSDAPAECESPIERRLAVFLVPYAEQWGFKVIPQFKYDRFRYDFAIEQEGKIVAVVECDGMEFHSTPEQLSRDVAKDLSARRAGFVPFRYRGTKIYADAEECAKEIIFRLWRHP